MKRSDKIWLVLVGVLLGVVFFGLPPADSHPSDSPCQRQGACRPDPQPDRGKDCEEHGKNPGGNQDHCGSAAAPAPAPAPAPALDSDPARPLTPVLPADLPQTGLSVAWILAAGLLALGSGIAIRRRSW